MPRVYGFAESDLERARSIVERFIDAQMSPHNSLYRGGDYYRYQDGDAELTLQRNYDGLDDDLAEEEFPDAAILLYVAGGERANHLAARLEAAGGQVKLLTRRVYSRDVLSRQAEPLE